MVAYRASTVPNFMILEWALRPNQADLTDAPDLKDGVLNLPDKPGIGIELKSDALKESLAPGSQPL